MEPPAGAAPARLSYKESLGLPQGGCEQGRIDQFFLPRPRITVFEPSGLKTCAMTGARFPRSTAQRRS